MMDKRYSQMFIAFTLMLFTCTEGTYDHSLVKIAQGALRGVQRESRKNEIFYSFRSIPYGEAPIGSLRFMSPVPHKGWSGIYEANTDLPLCYQSSTLDNEQTGVEDCLRLNVFTRSTNPSDNAAPVMVFIHGGGFVQGDGTETFYSPNFLMDQNVVIVTVAYRVGILGFCSLGIGSSTPVTANAGLKDQNLALKWVKNNIRMFGGNPGQVTLFGQSAGAASNLLHMFSPLSEGLFHKVIAQSASILNSWTYGKPGSCEAIAKYLNITTTNSKKILTALQAKSPDELLSVQFQALGGMSVHEPSYYCPVIEGNLSGAFLPFDPVKLLNSKSYTPVPILMGYNNHEGILLDIYNLINNVYIDIYDIVPLIPFDLRINDNTQKLAEVVEQTVKFYFNGTVPTLAERSLPMVQFTTDIWFAHGIIRLAKIVASTANVYFYRFSCNTTLNVFKNFIRQTGVYPGAGHLDEIGYLFETILTPAIATGSLEDELIDTMVLLWTTFAKDDVLLQNIWTNVEAKSPDLIYLDISNKGVVQAINPDEKRMTFWNDIYENYGIIDSNN